jgi:hypothetical protein
MMRNTRQVSRSVATVIPEIGVEDDPISPVNRDDTVTKRKPNSTIKDAPSRFPRRCNCGAAMITAMMARQPMITTRIDKSRSVRGACSRGPW